jgi:integral membrane protein
MRIAALAEGLTLLVLVLIAVPLKHVAGYAPATAIMGPIHGAAFLVYIGVMIDTVSGRKWPRREIVGIVAAAVIPFGAFFTLRLLARKEAALAA